MTIVIFYVKMIVVIYSDGGATAEVKAVMGRSKDEKAKSHQRIVEVAATKFREAGIDGIGIAELMAASDLSHGGFYRHFESREQLVAEAMELALKDGASRTEATLGLGPAPFDALVNAYLSQAHRDHWGESCAVSALANDVARSDQRTRSAYTRQVQAYLATFAKLVGGDAKRSRRASVAALSAVVGALVMARAVNDETLSLEILRETAAALKASQAALSSAVKGERKQPARPRKR